MIQTKFKCFKNAYQVTHYLRGRLYYFVDTVMTTDYYSLELKDISSFLFLIVKMIVLWLEIFPKTLLIPFIEGKRYPKLIHIDKNVALAMCGYEMMDMLKWFFCMCARTGFFFTVIEYK